MTYCLTTHDATTNEVPMLLLHHVEYRAARLLWID